MVEVECRQPMINTLPHLAWNPQGVVEKELFWLVVHRLRVTGYEGIPLQDEPHKLCVLMKAQTTA